MYPASAVRSAVATSSRDRTSEVASSARSGSTACTCATAAAWDSPLPWALFWRRNVVVACSMVSTSASPMCRVPVGSACGSRAVSRSMSSPAVPVTPSVRAATCSTKSLRSTQLTTFCPATSPSPTVTPEAPKPSRAEGVRRAVATRATTATSRSRHTSRSIAEIRAWSSLTSDVCAQTAPVWSWSRIFWQPSRP